MDKLDASADRDPRERGKREAASCMTFKDVVTEYLASVKDRQRASSRRSGRCSASRAPLHWRAIGSIGKEHIQAILDHHRVTLGHSRTAQTILVRLKTLWRWANKRDYVERHDGGAVLREHAHRARCVTGSTRRQNLPPSVKATGTLCDIERDFRAAADAAGAKEDGTGSHGALAPERRRDLVDHPIRVDQVARYATSGHHL